MEENGLRDPEDSSQGDEPNRVFLPLLQPAGNYQPHRTTNFYIDNILRPDFCCKRQDKPLVLEGEGLANITERQGAFKKISLLYSDGSKENTVASVDRHIHSKFSRPDLTSDVAVKYLTGDRNLCPEPEAGSSPAVKPMLWPAWVYCTRYSDRPSSGPRSRKPKKAQTQGKEDKRPRTAFTTEQLHRLKTEFHANRYLTEQRRQSLARDLSLNESQIKIWFQNKRAKVKKSSGNKNPLAQHLKAQGLYNHSMHNDANSDSE